MLPNEVEARFDRDWVELDRVERDRVGGGGEVRMDVVARIRGELAAGTYLTEEKWRVAVGRLVDVVLKGD